MGLISVPLFQNFNLTSAGLYYQRYKRAAAGLGTAFTAGSNVAVTSFSPIGFAPTGVGDLIYFATAAGIAAGQPAWTKRTIATKVADNGITVNTAIDLGLTPGLPWYRWPLDGGTASTVGWVNVRNMWRPTVKVVATTVAGDPVDVTIEGQLADSGQIVTIVTRTGMVTGDWWNRIIEEPYVAIRVGVLAAVVTGTDDITIKLEGTDASTGGVQG